MGAQFGESIGRTLLGGVNVLKVSEQYLEEVGASGDMSKPLTDLVRCGAHMDRKWTELPPREQERLKDQFATEVAGGILVPGGTAKVLKAAKFTEILPNVGKIAANVGGELSQLPGDLKKAGNAIKNLVNETEMVTPEGLKVKVKDHFLMNQADDLAGGARGPEHLPGNELLPKAHDVEKYLEKLPQRIRDKGKTTGILVTGEREIELTSGFEGPAASMPKKSPGFNIVTMSHAEGHAVAFMQQQGLTAARIYINNSKICSSCEKYFPRMLAQGSKLEVVLPDGTIKTFVGVA